MERREIWINYDRICNFDWTVNWAAILECLLCHHCMSIYILCHFCLNWFILCCLKLYQLSLSPYIWLLKAEPFFWRASKQHFLFSSFNSHLQELLCWASLHFEVSVGINVCLYFYSAPSFAMGFPLLLNCCAFQAFCGVLLDLCARTLFFAHFANSSHFYRHVLFSYSHILLSLIATLPYRAWHAILIPLITVKSLCSVILPFKTRGQILSSCKNGHKCCVMLYSKSSVRG